MRTALVMFAMLGCRVIDGDEQCAFEGICDWASDTPISALQRGDVVEGTRVEVRHALVTMVGPSGFYAQEPVGGPGNGVYVFAGDAGMSELVAEEELNVGHLVDIVGVYTEFAGVDGAWTSSLTELSDVDLDNTWSRGLLGTPIPEEVTADDLTGSDAEAWESMLVRVSGTLTATDRALPPELDGFAYVWVSDGADEFLVSVPAELSVGAGTTVSAIVGVVHNRYSNWYLTPRNLGDVQLGG